MVALDIYLFVGYSIRDGHEMVIKTVKDLRKALEPFKDETLIFVEIGNNDGCDTCGGGETSSEENVVVRDLENKIILSH